MTLVSDLLHLVIRKKNGSLGKQTKDERGKENCKNSKYKTDFRRHGHGTRTDLLQRLLVLQVSCPEIRSWSAVPVSVVAQGRDGLLFLQCVTAG